MAYLMRVNVRPDPDNVPDPELSHLNTIFDTYAGEVRIHGEPIGWHEIDEVELVEAPTVGGPFGWLVNRLSRPQTRYHLGIYLGREEAVLPNLSKQQALYALHAIAYYAPQPVRYTGPEGIVPLTGA